MKKLILTTLAVLAVQIQFAQDFQGMAVYQSKTQMPDISARMGGRDITPEMRARMEERIKRNLEKKFILNFDKVASIYKEEEKLDTPGAGGGGGMMMRFGQGGTLYKNIKGKTYTTDRDLMGKEFLIKDTLTTVNWQLTQETKQIGDYLCFKATAKVPNQAYKFKELRDKANKELSKENAEADFKKSTNLLPEINKENEVTAWYTPDIPVSNGPGSYQGLPGLILEVAEDKTIILCTAVVMNVKDKKEIKEPTKGKVVTQKEFDEISKAKMEEMMDSFRSRGGNQPMIRMGN
ncbi:GLPGLI family protein [Flavobacterium sp. H122]|uniref:GLPGLI family protein n=1 Tax=Flavobacterium sp. H122 TaxID=2529860 RepID=UPI0010AA633A|nr:GLPGLI family protein [Flavobacterium sp. H122]